MSLLMKALEKAAKDRGDARAEPAVVAATPSAPAAGPAPKSELTLEPLHVEPPPAAPASAPEPPARPASASRGPTAAPSREQAHAATVLEAGGGRAGSGAPARSHSLLAFGVIAAVFAIGFGTYVYLQVFHPSLFYKAPPAASKQPPVSPVAAAPATGSVPASAAPAAPATPEATPAIPAAPLLKESAPEPPPPARAQPQPQPQRTKPAPAPADVSPEAAPRTKIVVNVGSAAPAVNPVLAEAYGALQSQQLEPAKGAYDRLLRSEPRNTDALLGLAAIATLEGNNEEAIRRYMQVLDFEPRHAIAQSGLIGLLGRADPLAAESRLRQLIAREPSAFLYFTLGNLYADQSRWAPAQQAYFQAHHLEPNNPDYAYNLAVGLEHLSQPKLALGFYRRAVQLAGGAGRAQFNIALAQDRISKLASQVE